MAARREWLTNMLSDNGTNFVGAEKEIRELVNQLDHDQLQPMMSSSGVNRHWNPPLAPHFGGVFNSMETGTNARRVQTYFIALR